MNIACNIGDLHRGTDVREMAVPDEVRLELIGVSTWGSSSHGGRCNTDGLSRASSLRELVRLRNPTLAGYGNISPVGRWCPELDGYNTGK